MYGRLRRNSKSMICVWGLYPRSIALEPFVLFASFSGTIFLWNVHADIWYWGHLVIERARATLISKNCYWQKSGYISQTEHLEDQYLWHPSHQPRFLSPFPGRTYCWISGSFHASSAFRDSHVLPSWSRLAQTWYNANWKLKIRRRKRTVDLLYDVSSVGHLPGFHALQVDHTALLYDLMDKYNRTQNQNLQYFVQTCTKRTMSKTSVKFGLGMTGWAPAWKDHWPDEKDVLPKYRESYSHCSNLNIWFLRAMTYTSPLILKWFAHKWNNVMPKAGTWEIL